MADVNHGGILDVVMLYGSIEGEYHINSFQHWGKENRQ